MRRTCAGLAVAVLAATPVAAAAQPAAAGWIVRRDAFAELWYHGLALASAPRPAALALYSAAYTRDITQARRESGLGSRLDERLPLLRAALARDSVLEVLHFVPLYFVGVPPAAALQSLRDAFTGTAARDDMLARRAAAVAATLPHARHRATVLAFIDALGAEWRDFQHADAAARGPGPDEVGRLQRDWYASLRPALAPWLAHVGAERGTIVLVPAVGLDGRIARLGGGETVIVVGTEGLAAMPHAPLLAAVRELAFPVLDEMPAALRRSPADGRAAAEQERTIAAVRAGAFLLEALAPQFTASYRQLFATGGTGAASPRDFATRFPVSPAAERALRQGVSAHAARQTTQP